MERETWIKNDKNNFLTYEILDTMNQDNAWVFSTATGMDALSAQM